MRKPQILWVGLKTNPNYHKPRGEASCEAILSPCVCASERCCVCEYQGQPGFRSQTLPPSLSPCHSLLRQRILPDSPGIFPLELFHSRQSAGGMGCESVPKGMSSDQPLMRKSMFFEMSDPWGPGVASRLQTLLGTVGSSILRRFVWIGIEGTAPFVSSLQRRS